MGYTHSWCVPLAHRDYLAVWPAIVEDTRRIIDAVRGHGIVIAGYDGWRRPTLDSDGHGIAFNGDASTDLDADTFRLTPPMPVMAPLQRPVNFCKTNRKPYDLAVAAVLLRCHLLLPGVFLIRSNGAWDTEWAHGASATSSATCSARYPPPARSPSACCPHRGKAEQCPTHGSSPTTSTTPFGEKPGCDLPTRVGMCGPCRVDRRREML